MMTLAKAGRAPTGGRRSSAAVAARNAEICRLYDAGKSVEVIAELMGLSMSHTYDVIRPRKRKVAL